MPTDDHFHPENGQLLPASAESCLPGLIRILCLEDDAADQFLVAQALKDAGLICQVCFVKTEAEYVKALGQAQFDLILSDYTLPGIDGRAALAAAHKHQPDIPFIFVSGTIGDERAVEGLKSGATDYILKDHLYRLGLAVSRALREAELRRGRRVAETALKSSEQRLRLLFENAPDAFYVNDLAGRFLDGNRAAEQLVGYDRQELLGKSFLELDLLKPVDLARAANGLARAAQGQPTGPEEYTLKRKHGGFVTVEVRTYPIEIEQQTLVLGIARDITDRKLAEHELRQSEARLRSVWDQSVDGMRLTDHRGRIIAVNEAYCRLVQLPAERLVGELFSVAYAENGNEGALEGYLERFASGNLVPRRTVQAKLWNLEQLDLDVASSFVENGDRERLVLTIFRDISERQQSERLAAAFSNLGRRLCAAQSARGAAEIIVDVADQLLGWDCCICDLYSPATELVSHVLTLDIVNGSRAECLPHALTHAPSALARRVLEQGGQLILRGQGDLPEPSTFPFGDTSRMSASILYVPIRKGAEIAGLLSIQSYSPNAYNQESLKTLETLADLCGGAINRIRAQEDLQTAQTRLQHFLAESPAVIYSLKHEGTEFVPSWYSLYLQQLLGFAPDEACQPGWWSAQVHPEDRGTVQDWLTRLLTHKRLTRQYRLRHKNGEYRWIRDEQRLVCDAHGEPMEVVGSWVDITEQKALEEAQRRLAAAVEQAAETIIITDVHGVIEYVNPAFEQVTGYTRAEAIGQNPRLLKSGNHDSAFYVQLWDDLSHGRSWHGRLVNKRKDGRLIEADATITPIRDAAGKIINYVAVEHDVTHQVQLESQLRQAQKMEAIGQLAGGVAHDFNNLLLVMRGNAELLQMEPVAQAAPVQECLQQITAATDRAANLTRQLLAFSRKQVLQSRPLVLNEVISDLAKMLKRIIGEHIALHCHYSIGLPCVQADAGMIEQALVNLVVNARDAMPSGGQLHITSERVEITSTESPRSAEARPGEFVCLSVRDSGTGIDPENLPRIFEPFFTTKQAGKGTGLGLATVYGIIKQHRGWIEVDSRPGVGSTFRILLPTVPAPPTPSGNRPEPAAPPRGSETILLVEDDDAVRKVTRRVLETSGYKIHEATRAKEALDLWATHRQEIDLLLSDVVMPEGISGWDLADQLYAESPDLKVVLMSGYSTEAVAGKGTEFLSKSSARFLQKPCSAHNLLATLRSCLDGDPGDKPEATS